MCSLSVIIVNYKSSLLILDCIRSIKDQTKNISYEIIVVDNLSEDSSKDIICKAYSDITWVQMSYNSGFARANNAGIHVSKGTVVLLLNPDTIVVNEQLKSVF